MFSFNVQAGVELSESCAMLLEWSVPSASRDDWNIVNYQKSHPPRAKPIAQCCRHKRVWEVRNLQVTWISSKYQTRILQYSELGTLVCFTKPFYRIQTSLLSLDLSSQEWKNPWTPDSKPGSQKFKDWNIDLRTSLLCQLIRQQDWSPSIAQHNEVLLAESPRRISFCFTRLTPTWSDEMWIPFMGENTETCQRSVSLFSNIYLVWVRNMCQNPLRFQSIL